MKKMFALPVLAALLAVFTVGCDQQSSAPTTAMVQEKPTQARVEQGITALEGECAQGQREICNDSGLLLLYSADVEPAWRTRGMAMLQKACDASFELSCNQLEMLQGVADNVAKYSAQCEQGDAAACTEVGSLTFFGMAGAPDRATARQYLAIGCKDGQRDACERGAMLDTLAEVDGPEKLARQLDAACEVDLDKCFELGTALMTGGHGIERDRTRGRILLENVCKKRNSACDLLQHFDMHPQMLAELESTCRPGQPRACNMLANHLWIGTLGVQDRARAGELFTRTCDSGYTLACVSHDFMRLSDAQPEAGKQ